ncbi:MAG: pyrimidine-nucleoside phosphorylase [Chloroflexi bacterium]|nr:pyrimidine-nucleoside phosphorylase [Chloroflexota bacterium]
MRVVDLIEKKRDGEPLTTEEINYFIKGFTSGEISDYQASAMAMAIYFRGMTPRETADLTMAMAHSGDTMDVWMWNIAPVIVDKHSTGGVGDKTTLVVEPLVASLGLPVGKMSGRGLGFSGGTLDKMESFTGYRVQLTTDEFKKQLQEIGLVLAGQTADLAPADGKLYALRDVTGTVPSMPLIASSIMSKKLAVGAHAIVLDVKVGNGAFMPTLKSAIELGQTMVRIGKSVNRKVVALISDMNQPLGYAVGNALEAQEAIETLRGGGPEDFREHCLHVASYMLVLGKQFKNLKAARKACEKALADGSALAKFRQLVVAQGGDGSQVDDPDKLPKAKFIETISSPKSGYLKTISAKEIGIASVHLGAGRAKKTDSIDLAVGFLVHHKVGDKVNKGDPLFTVHANDEAKLTEAKASALVAHTFSKTKVRRLPLFYKTLT